MKLANILDKLEKFKCMFLLEGITIGILSGLAVSLFRFMVTEAEGLHDTILSGKGIVPALLFFVIAYTAICLLLKFDANCSGSGIPRVKGELAGQLQTTWHKSLSTMLAGSVCAIGAGLSMGQVGPSAQLGAMAAKGFSKLSDRLKKHEALFMCAGAGAGFSAILNTPLASVAFSMEEMQKRFSGELLLTSLAACISSDFVTSCLFGFEPLFAITPTGSVSAESWWLLVILGIITGVSGVIYNLSIKWLQACYKRLQGPWLRIAVPVIIAAVLAAVYPYALGGGNTLIYDFLNVVQPVQALLILLLIKYGFTVLCFSSGSPGGLIGPVLVIGAIIGCLFAVLTGYGEYASLFMLLGMAGYFVATTRALFTGVILAAEIAGTLAYVPHIALVCLCAYCVADLTKSKPIFEQLLENILKAG